MRRVGKIGVYGPKTRDLQRRLTYEAFGLTMKSAKVFLYLGDATRDNPDITDVQFTAFAEVADRAYAEASIEIPVGMDRFMEEAMDFSRFGIINPMGDEHNFRFHVDDFIPLGRHIIVGDVFELPFYSTDEKASYWEVTDVDDKLEAEKFITIVKATPLSKNRKTRDIEVDGDNADPFIIMMDQAETEQSQDVPVGIPTFEEAPEEEEVDNRNDGQSSFLDDLNKTF